MADLNFEDLIADSEKTAKFVNIKAPDGSVVKLRDFSHLPGADFKTVLKYIDILQDDKIKENAKVDAMDLCLVAAADRKDALKEMLDLLPLSGRETIFNAWMEAAEVPES